MTDNRSTVIVADADQHTLEFLAAQLTADGYDVLGARSPVEVSARATRRTPALLLLGDFERHGESIGLLRELRAGDGRHGQLDPALPVVTVSADRGELAELRSFDAGADDHLTKPFSYAVLRARLSTVLRRVERPDRSVVRRVGALSIDRSTRDVRLRDRPIELSKMEFALLDALCEHPCRVYGKAELLRDVWGFRSPGRTRTVESHACRLRHKLSAVAGDRFVVNVWGVGYRLVDPIGAERDEVA